MFKKRTLFVLGAGASFEFKLPLGPGLASTIAKNMDVRIESGGTTAETPGGDLLNQIRRNRGAEVNDYMKAFRLIQHGVQLSSSIDDFLDVHASNERAKRIGKMAIVKTVLEAERDSLLYLDKSNIYNRIAISHFEHTWIVKFMRMLGRGLPIEDKERVFDNVAFIVFNYDRCLEHFLAHALQQFYAIDENAAAAILEKLTIIHPYGVAAPFKARNGGDGYYFGADRHGSVPDYWSLAEGIRTYTEQRKDHTELDRIHDEVLRAERIVFLGFGFHDQNIRLLKPDEGVNSNARFFATAKGMSESDVALVKTQLNLFYSAKAQQIIQVTQPNQIRPDLSCAQIFDSYNKSLPE